MEAQCCLFPYVIIKYNDPEVRTSQSDFSLTIPGLIGIDFEPRQEKNWEENLLEQRIEERSNNNSTHPRRQYLNPVYILGGECSHHCVPPASLKRSKQTTHSLVLTLTALPHSRSTHFTLEGTVSAHKVFISLPLAKRFKPGAECIWTNVDTSC